VDRRRTYQRAERVEMDEERVRWLDGLDGVEGWLGLDGEI
jgi:hypothetical protein